MWFLLEFTYGSSSFQGKINQCLQLMLGEMYFWRHTFFTKQKTVTTDCSWTSPWISVKKSSTSEVKDEKQLKVKFSNKIALNFTIKWIIPLRQSYTAFYGDIWHGIILICLHNIIYIKIQLDFRRKYDILKNKYSIFPLEEMILI